MQILYRDKDIVVCVKDPGILSTDEPGGLPELVRAELGNPKACVRTVHRLDRVVSGLMVLARSPAAASELSRQIRDRKFHKEYLAIVRGVPEPRCGVMKDLLMRDAEERKTYVAEKPGKDVQEAILNYGTLDTADGLSKVQIVLQTGRTHQIRAQFSSRGLPLWGDRKYGGAEEAEGAIALWSYRLRFRHPNAGIQMDFCLQPPNREPWTKFDVLTQKEVLHEISADDL